MKVYYHILEEMSWTFDNFGKIFPFVMRGADDSAGWGRIVMPFVMWMRGRLCGLGRYCNAFCFVDARTTLRALQYSDCDLYKICQCLNPDHIMHIRTQRTGHVTSASI